MSRLLPVAACIAVLALALSGCATSGGAGADLGGLDNRAWALDISPEEFVVAVSPAKQTLGIAGTYGRIIGGSISAVANDRYRQEIDAAFAGYDPISRFGEITVQRLAAVDGATYARVTPLRSTAGFNSRSEAQRERYQRLERQGFNLLIDLNAITGLFGPQAALAVELTADARTLPKGRAVQSVYVAAVPGPVLASDRLRNPVSRIAPDLKAPRLSTDEQALARWTRDGGVALKLEYEAAVNGALSAILLALGIAEDATGAYYLGKQALYDEDLEGAARHFAKAVALDGELIDARAAQAVVRAHQGDVEGAIRMTEAVVAQHADYGAGHYNLAWWYAMDRKDVANARIHYERSLALGMPIDPTLEEALLQQ